MAMQVHKGHRIEEADITHISMVRRPANRTAFGIVKSENALDREVPIVKTDSERRLVYGVVYAPNVPDSHGDWMSEIEIEKAAHKFMKNGPLGSIDHEHNLRDTGSVVVESFVARKGDETFPAGAWVVGVHVADPKLWQMVKSGEITGFSMYGQGTRTPATIEIEKSDGKSRVVKQDAGWPALWNELVKQPFGTVVYEVGGVEIVRSSVIKGDGEVVPCADFRTGTTILVRKFEDGTEERVNMTIRKSAAGNYREPATGGEETFDTAEKQARRDATDLSLRLQAERDAKSALANRLAAERRTPDTDAAIRQLERDIALIDAQLAHLPGDVQKGEDAFTLLEKGIATNFVRRGGTSMTVDASALPEKLSKADQQFADDLMSDLLGVRRRAAAAPVKKSDDDELFSNPFGLRNYPRR